MTAAMSATPRALTRSEKARRAADYDLVRTEHRFYWSPEDKALAYAMWDAAWARHQTIYEAAIRTIDEANRERAALRDALRAFVDEEPCRLDHHGNCQAHNLSKPCDVARARELLGLEPRA